MSDEAGPFTRPDTSYDVAPSAVRWILEDAANPLHRLVSALPAGSRVLDIGAGNGLLARVLAASHKGVTIDGLEPNPYAADLARPHYRHFHTGYVEDHLDDIMRERYDYLVLADVIEHAPDPSRLLRALAIAGGEHARILISTPNVAFGALRVGLLNGRFDYVDSGLLERTHMRFFTRATLMTLFRDAGLGIEREVFHQKHLLRSEIVVERSLRNFVELMILRRRDLALTYQFFYALRPGWQPRPPVRVERFGHRTTLLDLMAWFVVGWGQRRRRTAAASTNDVSIR